MKQEDIKQIVEENFKPMKKMMGLSLWRITVDYGPVEWPGKEGMVFVGRCRLDPSAYEWAEITIDPDMHEDKEDVLATLQHELVHCVVNRLSIIGHAVEELVTKKEFRALEVLFYHVTEEIVERFCQILNGVRPISSFLETYCCQCGRGPEPGQQLFNLGVCGSCLLRLPGGKNHIPKEDLIALTAVNAAMEEQNKDTVGVSA